MLISTFTNFGNAETCTVSLAGKSSFKIFSIHLIHLGKTIHIRKKNGCLYYVAEIHTCLLAKLLSGYASPGEFLPAGLYFLIRRWKDQCKPVRK